MSYFPELYTQNFNDFNNVNTLHLWFLFIMYGSWLFLFPYKLYSHDDIFKKRIPDHDKYITIDKFNKFSGAIFD